MVAVSCQLAATPSSCLINMGAYTAERIGDFADDTLYDEGHEIIAGAVDASIEHAILFAQFCECYYLLDVAGCATNFFSIWETLELDIINILGNIVGIRDLSELEERYNETKIAWAMLESLIRDNYGDWDAMVVNAGFPSGSNPSMDQIIDGFADRLGYHNLPMMENQYVRARVNELFLKGAYEFGDWLEARRVMANPFDDVDGDGISNDQDPDPNDPLIPPPEIVNRPPIAKINSSYTGPVVVGTNITLYGDQSSDPDRDSLTYQWAVIGKPSGSGVSLAGGNQSQFQLVPDVEGSYTIALAVSDDEHIISTQMAVTAYKIYSTDPVLLPEQKIIGPISGGADSRKYYYIDLPDTSVTKIIVWMYGASKATAGPADVYVSYNKNPTVAFTHPYDPTVPEVTYQYGDPNDLSREEFEINNPKVGRYHLLLYGFMNSYSNVNLFYQFERGVADADEDGVPDDNDAFFNDPSASLDTDGDDYPDAWNPGKLETDSSTGLRIDSAPTIFGNTPSDPAIGVATAVDGQATVVFTPPIDNGGHPITNFKAISNPVGFTGECSAPCSSVVISGLTNGESYTFMVAAQNSLGDGTYSAESNSVIPQISGTVPDAPIIGNVTAGNRSAVVNFSAPASDGGNPITKYTAISNPGAWSSSCTAPCSSITVNNLTNGSAYTFTVKAINAAGPSAPSATSTQIVPVAQYTVKAIAGAGGKISPDTALVSQGETATFIVTPDTGYAIASVIGCDGALNNDTYTTGAITGPCTVTASFEFIALDQTITFSSCPKSLSIGNTGDLFATASSGLTVEFVSKTPNICKVKGSTVTAISKGLCTVAANQPGNSNYLAAPEIERDINVSDLINLPGVLMLLLDE